MKHEITAADIMPVDDYARIRAERKAAVRAIKDDRRMEVGPCATILFENYETIRQQIHEMLFIERGGEEQMKDELRAYNPLVPKENEFVATVLFSVSDPAKRATFLAELGGVEKSMELRIGSESVKGVPEDDLDYTSADGKASSVQFVHFQMTSAQADLFRADAPALFAITHPAYGHMATLPEKVRKSLSADLG